MIEATEAGALGLDRTLFTCYNNSMNRRLAVGAVLCVCLVVSGCDERKSVIKGRIKDAWGQISDKDYVRVRGIGAIPRGTVGFTNRRGLSRNAALVAARYEMLAVIKGIKVTGGLTVGKLMQKDSQIREVADRIIHGAEEVKAEWAEDDGCIVTLELKRADIEKLVEQDKKWEPPSERDLFDAKREREYRERNDRDAAKLQKLTWHPTYPGEVSPGAALGWGLVFPGGGQLRQGDMLGGYYAASVIGLGGVGAYLYSPHETGSPRSDGTREKKRSEIAGLVFFSIAGFIHCYAAVDAMNGIKPAGGYFTFEPVSSGRGFGLAWNKKF